MITKEDIINCCIYNSNVKLLFNEIGLNINNNYYNFSFSCPNNSGKTTLLIKILLYDILIKKNNNKKYLFITNSSLIKSLRDKFCEFLNQLGLAEIFIDTVYQNKIIFENGSIIEFKNKLDIGTNYDIILIDDAEYFFNTTNLINFSLLYIHIQSNNRLIMSSSYINNNYQNIINDLKINHFNLNEEYYKIFIRTQKINKIKNNIKIIH